VVGLDRGRPPEMRLVFLDQSDLLIWGDSIFPGLRVNELLSDGP
jgi:hypothetical protein